MEHCTKVNGMRTRVSETDAAFRSGRTGRDMTASGKMEWHMDSADSSTQRETFTKVSGSRIKLKDTEFNKTFKEAGTKDSGIMINKMVKEKKCGLMVQYTKVNIKTE